MVDLSSSLCGSLPGRVHFWWSFLLLVTLYGYMDQYLYIPFLVGWTSIYQPFWGSLGTRVLTHPHFIWVTGWLWIFHSPRGRDHAMLTCLPTACSEAVLSQWLAPTFIHSGTLEGARCEREHPWIAGPKMVILDGKIRYNPSILLVVVAHEWIMTFHSVGNVIIPPDEVIFFRGVGWNHQPVCLYPIHFWFNGLIIGFSNTAFGGSWTTTGGWTQGTPQRHCPAAEELFGLLLSLGWSSRWVWDGL